MKEYYGSSAQNYKQASSKEALLTPAILRNLPKGNGKSLLDLGCGDGFFQPIAKEFGYNYTGIDISLDMISKAKKLHEESEFIVSSSTNFTDKINAKFDIILINMMFPSISNLEDIQKTLIQCKKVLNSEGRVIIGTTHPMFDGYMQKEILKREDILTEFTDYFASGTKYTSIKDFDGKRYEFEDFHWTLKDYISAINFADLKIDLIDECAPSKESNLELKFPKYIVFVLKI